MGEGGEGRRKRKRRRRRRRRGCADLMSGMSWMVQQVLGKPGRGISSVQVTL